MLTRELLRVPGTQEPAPRARQRPALFFSLKSQKQWQTLKMNNSEEPQTQGAWRKTGLPSALQESENPKIKVSPFSFPLEETHLVFSLIKGIPGKMSKLLEYPAPFPRGAKIAGGDESVVSANDVQS